MTTISTRFTVALFGAALAVLALPGCTSKEGTPQMDPPGVSKQALTPGCGNGVVEPERSEACDDGNLFDGDGCSTTCTLEPGWVCVGERPTTCSAPDQSDAPASFGKASHGRSLPPVSPFVGRDFWTTFPSNANQSGWATVPTGLALKIAGVAGTTGSVTSASGAVISNFTIPAGGVVTVQPNIATYHLITVGTVTAQGVHITADADVRVIGTNEHTYTTDTWSVWDTSKLGKDYIVIDGSSGGVQQFALVGTKANTAVTIANAAGVVQANITLNAGSTYLRQPGTGMVGWTVTASEPVVLIAGNDCTNDVGSACDMTAEQIPPVRNWARDYAIAPTFNSSTAKYNHVVLASQDNTTVIITKSDGTQQTLTLNARQSNMFVTGSTAQLGYFITADKPIMVASNIGDPAGTWDPALVTWPPLDGYVSSAKMPTTGITVSYSNFLSVITRTSATANITVNGAAVTGWTAISTSGYSFARVAVPAGDNEILGANGVKFAAVASGGSTYVSYGYSSPYDIATVGGTTNCYLGSVAPDFEAPFTGSAAANQDDLAASDDEDIFSAPPSVQHGAASVSLTVACNDNYFGVDATATVHGWIDFNGNGTFEASERASGACVDSSPFTDGTASLTWTGQTYAGAAMAMARFRICDNTADCSAPNGGVATGEVEDHLVHIGTCGDNVVDSFEACDDGNTTASDGCSATCTVESGFTCTGTPSTCLLNTAPTITTPANNTLYNTTTFAVSGACTTGATVRVREGATVLCSAVCAASAYTCTTSAVTDGSHGITANQTIGSQGSVDSAVVTVRIDTLAPNAPVITAPVAASVTSNTAPVTSGTCEPGATVTILNGGAAWCTASCTLARTFTCTPSAQAAGAKSLTGTQVDVGGRTSPVSATVAFTIDTTAPTAPTMTAPTAGVDPGTALPTYTGACETDATVKVIENLSTVLCTTTCVASAYSCVSSPLVAGSHTVQARQWDVAGNASPYSPQLTFPITVVPNLPPTISAPTAGEVITVSTPTITMSCVSGQVVNVYEGAAVICTGTCALGLYSCTPTMTDGTHTVDATQVKSGSESAHSPGRTFLVDTTPPLAPAITVPSNGGGAIGPTPAISGTCESGTTVRVYEGAAVRCTATCAASAFSCTSSAVAAGAHTYFATQTDPANNVSPNSPNVAFTVTVCGNGVKEAGEGCDDNNLVAGDGCSVVCVVESGYACTESGGGLSTCGCGTDAVCVSTSFCNDGTPNACAAKLPAGSAIPAGHGTCGGAAGTIGAATAACQTGACNATTNTCALAVGQVCTNANQCVTNACSGGLCVDSMFLNTTAGTTTYVGNHAAVVVDPTLTVTGTATLANAVVSIGTGFSANNDKLNYTTVNGITGVYDAARGTLTLSGSGTTAQYQQALRSVTFSNSSTTPTAGARVVNFSIGNAVSNPDNGHFYEYVSYSGTWTAAKAQAEARKYLGLSGYLASITSLTENDFIKAKLSADGWIGAKANPETAFPRSWYWQGGPDHNVQFCTNNSSGVWAVTNSLYANWATGEPNNAGGEGCGQIYFANAGKWNDLPCNSTTLSGYVVEYGGSAGDPVLQVTGTRNVDVQFTASALVASASTLTYLAGDPATIVDPGVSAAGTNAISSATVQLVTGFVTGQDGLAMPTTNGISASFNAGTGVLTLSGAGTTADYQAAFRAVTYLNLTSPLPTTALRTVRFTMDGKTADRALQVKSMPSVALAASPSPATATFSVTLTATLTPAASTGTVTFTADGLTLGTGTLSGGVATLSTSSLAPGAHSLTADYGGDTQRQAAQGTASLTVNVAAPAFTAPVAGAFVSSGTPTVSLSCTTSATVTVTEGATTVCTGACVAGAYSCTPALTDGAHALTATQDIAGTTSTVAGPRSFTVDTGVPLAPGFTSPADLTASTSTTPAAGGACETGTTVVVLDGATSHCSVTCAASAWSCTLSALSPGFHSLVARQTDTAGNVSPDSATVHYTVTVCGNGVKESGEGCDDNNLTAGDGCSATCATESGFTCTVNGAGLSVCGCDADTSCLGTEFCASGTPNLCTAKLPAGSAIPAGHGACGGADGALGAAIDVCQTAQCNPTTNTCALAVGQVCTNANQCVTNACTGGLCVDTMFLTTTVGTTDWVGNHAAVAVDPTVSVTGTATLSSAMVSIGAGFSANNDKLNYTTVNGITGTYDAARGILTLTGSATTAQYQQALRTVTFSNPSTTPVAGTRVVTFSIGNAVSNPANGHFYEYVAYVGTWTQAKAQAEARKYLGMAGYLASITSASENAFITAKLTADGWIGAKSNPETSFPRNWYWQGGPDHNVQFCSNPSGGSWTVTNGLYANWATGEPNNYPPYGEGCGQIYFANAGKWNDLPCNTGNLNGYVVEYGGSAGDPVLQVSGTRDVNVIFTPTAVANAGSTLLYTHGDPATVVSPTVTVAGTNAMSSATVAFTAGYVAAEDTLAMPDTNGLTASFAGGTLTISGAGTAADYQAAFRAVTYVNSVSPRPTTALRTLRFLVDGVSTTRSLQVRALPLVVVTSSASPAPFGQSVSLTATLTPAASTGTVTFKDGAATLGTVGVSGGAATFTSASLAVGPHAITATYSGDTERLGADGTFTQDIVSLPPTIGAPTEGQAVNVATLVLGCVSGRDVTVYEGAAVLCTGACVAGAYTCTPTLSEGPHAITATQTAFAMESAHTAARTFTYDTLVPLAPVLQAPVDGTGSTNPTPVASGSCESDTLVSVYEGATLRCSAPCVASAFSCTSPALSVGSHTWLARQTDAAGNVSPDSNSTTFGVSLCGNGTTELGEACDDANTAAGDGCSALCAREPGFACSGTPSVCSAVCGDGVQTSGEACDDGNTTAGDGCSAACAIEAGYLCANASPNLVTNGGFDDGNVGFTSNLSYLGTGTNTLANQYSISTGNAWRPDVCANVADGERSVANKSLYFNAGSDPAQVLYQTDVSVTAGKKYIVEAYAMSWTAMAPPRMVISLGGVDLTAEFTAVVCDPGSPWTRISASYEAASTGPITLKVYDRETAAGGNDGALDGFSVREAVASSCAQPSIAALSPVAQPNQAAYTVHGDCVVGAGNVTASVGSASQVVACTAGAWTATFDVTAQADTADLLVGLKQSNASGTATITAHTLKDTVTAPPAITAPVAAAWVATGTPDFSGTCETGATVRVYEGSTLLCSSPCASAAFACTSSVVLPDGEHTVLATGTDALGNLSADSAAVTFTVDTVAPAAPAPLQPVASLRTNVVQPTFSGTCEPAAMVGVSEGTTLLCSVVCDASGTFSCVSSTLTEGLHPWVTRQTDRAGNTSADSPPRDLIIDVTPPAEPTIAAPAAGLYTSDATPTVWGTCETDATVRVFEGTVELCSAVCVVGEYACDASALVDGSHALLVRQTDVAGNTGADAARSFTVDTVVDAPTWSAPNANAFLSTQTPALSGGCETEATVTVKAGGVTLCTSACVASQWSCTPGTQPEGEYVATATQVDHANNASAGADRTFTLDVTAPVAPVVSAPVEGDFIQARRTAVSGTCEEFATVEVLERGNVLCSAPCVGGTYTCTTPTLSEGEHTFVARQTDRAGNLGATSSGPTVTFDVTAPQSPVLTTPRLGLLTATTRWTLDGSCEPFARVLVMEGSATVCDAVCTAGGAFTCPAQEFAEGRHDFALTQTDRANNTSLRGGHFFTVDLTAPVVPTVLTPKPNALMAANATTVTGTGEPNSTVQVYVDGQVVCTVTVGSNGFWTCGVTGLGDGKHQAQAASWDAVSNTSTISGNVPFTVDTKAPAAPTIALPLAGQATSAYPSFSGRGEPGSTVTVRVDGQPVCAAVVDVTGAWACIASAALAESVHRAVAIATDAAGNASPASAAVDFVVSGQAAPGAPVLSSPKAGSAVDTNKPIFSGQAEPGATVVVKVDGQQVCTATASSTGAWTCTASAALADGAHQATATATTSTGTSLPCNPVGFALDTQAPAAPVLTAPAAGSDVGPRPVLAGTAEAGSTVTVKVDGQVACVAVSDVTGHFACTSSVDLAPGAHAATATATDAAGHASAASASRSFTVKGGLPPAAPVVIAPAEGAALRDVDIVFSGTAEPGSTVSVTVDGQPACTAQVGPSGEWTCTAKGVTDGAHSFSATTTGASGTSAASATGHFSLDTHAPAAPVVTQPAANATTGPWPVYAGTAEAGSLVSVKVDGVEVCTAVATSAGAFTCATKVPLAPGAHSVTATATDVATWTSAPSAAQPFIVAVTAPSITAPVTGQAVGTAKPVFSGHGEPGVTVTVLVDGQAVCTATVDAQGAWTCTADTALADGPHAAQARTDDGYGHSQKTQLTYFSVDTTAPKAPAPTSPKAGQEVLGSTVTFTGTAEPGSTVTVTVDGQEVCTAVVDAAGNWSCTATNVAGGSHTVTTTTTDPAGNTSTTSVGVGFSSLTSLPAPVITTPVEGARITGPSVSFAGTATPRTTVEVLDESGQVLCTARVDADGAWSCSTEMAAGERSVTAKATSAGLATGTSDARGFTVLEDVRMYGGAIGCSQSGGAPALLALALAGLGLLRRRR